MPAQHESNVAPADWESSFGLGLSAQLGPSQLPEELSDRISREDKLLSDRTGSFVAASAFLAVAFATLLVGVVRTDLAPSWIEWGIVALGLSLAYFFLALGRRTIVAISFWRACSNSQDTSVGDRDLFHFFEDGHVEYNDGCVRSLPRGGLRAYPARSVRGAWPWRFQWIGSANEVTGVIIPVSIAVFWCAASFSLRGLAPLGSIDGYAVPPAGVIVSLSALIVFGLSWYKRPARAYWWPPRDEILAVMGRGIRRDRKHWRPTNDREMYRMSGDRPAHQVESPPADDADDLCLVAGGQLNVDAACVYLREKPMLTLLGFAHQAQYLSDSNPDGPTESAIMSDFLQRAIRLAEIERCSNSSKGVSNTMVEVRNILDFAEEHAIQRVWFLSIESHLIRVQRLVEQFRRGRPQLRVRTDFLSSEKILLDNGGKGAERVVELRRTKAYARTRNWELQGAARV